MSKKQGLAGGLPPQLAGAGGSTPGAHSLPLRNLAYPCGGEQAMDAWFALPQVKKALHVRLAVVLVELIALSSWTQTDLS